MNASKASAWVDAIHSANIATYQQRRRARASVGIVAERGR